LNLSRRSNYAPGKADAMVSQTNGHNRRTSVDCRDYDFDFDNSFSDGQ
jgi:hypothetical protein